MNLVRSAVVRLTLAYLAIIMLLSVGFSVLLYRVSVAELYRSASRPLPTYFYQQNLNSFRMQELQVGEMNLRRNLLSLNLVTLMIGGAASYWLARRTLHPLETAIEAQSRFASDASHELRTPLTAMQTEIEVALRNKALTTTQLRQLLKSNLEEVAKLRDLSGALLRLSRQESREIERAKLDLAPIAKQAVERFANAAKQKKIQLVQELKPAWTKGDATSLEELTAVLIDNAIKYSPSGTKITVKTTTAKQQARLQVVDQGIGIKAGDLAHVFDRFYRADSSRSKQTAEGYGLGLSLAKHIADAHHGSIEVTTVPGKGSTFSVNLPRHASA